MDCETILTNHGLGRFDDGLDLSGLCAELAAAVPVDRRLDEEGGESDSFATFQSVDDWINLGVSAGCIFGAALAAGLTMSIVSLEPVDLRVKIQVGLPKLNILGRQQMYAKRWCLGSLRSLTPPK